MESIEHKLLTETARFLEICQTWVLKQKLTSEEYANLTDIKYDFIKKIFRKEKSSISENNELRVKISKLLENDSVICNLLSISAPKQ